MLENTGIWFSFVVVGRRDSFVKTSGFDFLFDRLLNCYVPPFALVRYVVLFDRSLSLAQLLFSFLGLRT